MKKEKLSALRKALFWCVCMLMFPILSGVLSALFSLGTIETLFLQGIFMLCSLFIPLSFVLAKRWSWDQIGCASMDIHGCRRMLYFFPMLAILAPAAAKGFHVKSAAYLLGTLFLYLTVGVAEEVYFRGIIPQYLNKTFSRRSAILLSALIFGTGHIASAFTASNGLEIFLTVLNAFIFGWLTMEMAVICKNIAPGIVLHVLFDFETKVVVMQGTELLLAEGIRGVIMVIEAVWLAVVLEKSET